MALELQVYAAVIDTEPAVPGNPGIVVRSQKTSTLVGDLNATVANVWAIADARLSNLAGEVVEDARGQIQLLEHTAAAEGI